MTWSTNAKDPLSFPRGLSLQKTKIKQKSKQTNKQKQKQTKQKEKNLISVILYNFVQQDVSKQSVSFRQIILKRKYGHEYLTINEWGWVYPSRP